MRRSQAGMMTNWGVWWITLTVVSAACGSIASGPPDQIRVEVSVQERSGQGHVLHVTVTNVSAAPLSVAPSTLPWGNRWSFFVTAVAWGEVAHHLQETGGIDDPPPQQHFEIKPGETLQGDVILRDRFKGLDSHLDLAKEDVLIGWAYPFRPDSTTRSEWHTGWLTIPVRHK